MYRRASMIRRRTDLTCGFAASCDFDRRIHTSKSHNAAISHVIQQAGLVMQWPSGLAHASSAGGSGNAARGLPGPGGVEGEFLDDPVVEALPLPRLLDGGNVVDDGEGELRLDLGDGRLGGAPFRGQQADDLGRLGGERHLLAARVGAGGGAHPSGRAHRGYLLAHRRMRPLHRLGQFGDRHRAAVVQPEQFHHPACLEPFDLGFLVDADKLVVQLLLQQPQRSPVADQGGIFAHLPMIRKHCYIGDAMPRLLLDITPLRESPQFRRLWIGTTLSAVGASLTSFAVTLQIYDLTRSPFAVGLIGLAQLIPLLTVGAFGGPLLDSGDRRKVMFVTSCGLAAVSALFAVQAYTDPRELWLLYTLAAVQAGLNALSRPLRCTYVPALLPPAQLAGGLALNTMNSSIMLIIGPALAGTITAAPHLGLRGCYLIDTLTFTAALYGIARLPAAPAASGASQGGLRAVAEGFAFIRRHQVLGGASLAD